MSNSFTRCSAEETAACCCVDVGTVIDNTDCTASFVDVFATEEEAQQVLKSLTEKARATESEPCRIDSSITKTAQGVELMADFTFSCQAENMIFQLALR